MSVVLSSVKLIGGCNAFGYLATALLETHKLTDLVGVGSFVVAASSYFYRAGSLQNTRAALANGIVITWGTRLGYLFFSFETFHAKTVLVSVLSLSTSS
jgi:hypothetical protein